MDSAEQLNALLTTFRKVVHGMNPNNETELEVLTTMEEWSVNLSHNGTPNTLVTALFGKLEPKECSIYALEYAVGLQWFNPLSDAHIILTIPSGLHAELRDHDGGGKDLIPWWFEDALSDCDASDESIILDAVLLFVCECKENLDKYNKKLSQQKGQLSKSEFSQLLETLC